VGRRQIQSAGDSGLGEPRQVPAVAVARGDRGREVQLRDETLCRNEAPHRFDERHVADEGRRVRPLAVRTGVADSDRMQHRVGVDRALEERPVEGVQRAAVGGRSFGKHRDQAPGGERLGDPAVDVLRMATAAALDEERAGLRAERTDHRPASDILLGDEHRRAHREDRHHVEPRDVIGDEHAARRQCRGLVEASDPHI